MKPLRSADKAHRSASWWRLGASWLLLVVVLFFGGLGRAEPLDGGPSDADLVSPGDSQSSRALDAAVAASDGLQVQSEDTEPWSAERWRQSQLAELKQQLRELRVQIEAVGALEESDLELSPSIAVLLPGDLRNPQVVAGLLSQLANGRRQLAAQLKESSAQLRLLTTALSRPIGQLERWQKRQKRRAALRIPQRIVRASEEAQERLTLAQLRHAVLKQQLQLLEIETAYLVRSQPARTLAWRREHDPAEQERKAAQQAHESALQAEQAAQAAQTAALAEQQQARSEATRLLAGEKARLEGIRAEQARFQRELATAEQASVRLRAAAQRFRLEVISQTEALEPRWSKAAAAEFDSLYDRVVGQLVALRPMAMSDLWTAIRGGPSAPDPGALDKRLSDLRGYDRSLAQLRGTTQKLKKKASALARTQNQLILRRLSLLQEEVTWLNGRRTELLRRVTRAKRRDLTGFTPATLQQLTREVTQLVFDSVYWSFKRLRQIDEVPQLLFNLFTVGRLLWRALKLLLLLLFLRYALRNWDRWLAATIPRIARSIALGSHALRLARLVDVLRHSGRPLLVLAVAWLIYRFLGGDDSAVELRIGYAVVFWLALYRWQLRLVESAAKYSGAATVARAAELESAQDDGGDGDPELDVIEYRPSEELDAVSEQGSSVVSAPELAVRSVRTATRYLLAVVLVLDLAAIEVGKGTIYGLTVKFSWWAAIPFVFYLLQLWRPHILRAYQALVANKPPRRLTRLVEQAEQRAYGVVLIAAALGLVLADRATTIGRRYLGKQDLTKRVLAFLFRRRVTRQAKRSGQAAELRAELPAEILAQFPFDPITRQQGALASPAMPAIRSAFDTWKTSRVDGSTALVGGSGMGKSTTLEFLEQELGVPVIRAELRTKLIQSAEVVRWLAEVFSLQDPAPSTEEQLIRAIRADSRPVVALDNCHNLFLRQVGGFAGWDAFVRIVNETCDNVFWLLIFNAAAWDYLFQGGGRVHYFRGVIGMPRWSERRIQRLMMRRMQRSGYRVSFSDLVVAQVPDVDPSRQVGRTSSGYFRLLWDFADGNPRLASHFWLESLVAVAETREVRVQLFEEPSIAELEALPADLAFVLAAIAQHENLTVEQAASTTRLPVDFCRFVFSSAREDGYLDVDREGCARLSRRWQRSIMRFLKRKHLLSEPP